MTIRKIACRFSFVLFMLMVSSCAQSTEGAAIPPSQTPLLLASSVTPSPSSTPLPMGSPTLTLTPTAIPTLPVEAAQPELLKFLSNNGGCRLPCLWGIAPGKSSFQEAQVILIPLGSVSTFTAFKSGLGSVTPHFIEDNLEIFTTVDFIANQDNHIVNHVAFNAEAHKPLAQGGYEDVFDSKFFGEKVSAYTLAHVLTEQGVPSSIMLATLGGPFPRGGTVSFNILLLYPDQGILVNYKTQMHMIGAKVRGCPTNAYIQMELYPPGQPDSFFEGLKQTDWAVKMNVDYKPLEEVASMSVQEFYDTFREPTKKCIETPAKLWPTPES